MISWPLSRRSSFDQLLRIISFRLLEYSIFLIPAFFLINRAWTNSLLSCWIPFFYLIYCIVHAKMPLRLLWNGPALWCLILLWVPSIVTLGFSEAWREGRLYLWGIVTMCAAHQVQLDHKSFIHYFSMFLVLLGGLCGLDAVLQAFFKIDILGHHIESQRLVAFFSNPNYLGFFLAGIVPLSLLAIFKSDNLWQSMGFMGLSCLIFAGLFLSGTRSAWIAMAVSLFTVLPVFFKKNRRIFWVNIIVIFSCAILLAYLSSASMLMKRIFYFINYGDSRLKLWKDALEVIAMVPCFGLGIGNWVLGINGVSSFAHNFFLEIAMECGIPALILFLYMCVRIVMYLYNSLHRDDCGRFFMAAILAFLIASSVTIPFFSRYTITVLFPFLGLVLGYCDTVMSSDA